MTLNPKGRQTKPLPKIELFGTVEQVNSIKVDKMKSRSASNTYLISPADQDRALIGKYVRFNVDNSHKAIGLKPAKK